METLESYLTSNKYSVFEGTQLGGFLNTIVNIEITPDVPSFSDFSSLYTENFVNPFFITLSLNTKGKGPNNYNFQLDEYYQSNNTWYRQLGVALLATENKLIINETDGASAEINFANFGTKKKLTFTRSRSGADAGGNGFPFVQFAFMKRADCDKRNGSIKKCFNKNIESSFLYE